MAISRRTLGLIRELRRVVGGEADNAVRALASAWVKAWGRVGPGWQRATGDLIALAQQLGRWPTPVQIARVDAAARALTATDAELATLGTLTASTVTAGAAQIIVATADAEPAIIGSQLPAALADEFAERAARRILPSALDIIRVRTEQAIVAQTRPLSADAAEAMRRELIRGVQFGLNPNEAARRMVASVNGAFEGGLVRAVTIARTEMISAQVAASRYAHEANADTLRGWRWLASLDRRGCPACWAMHGTEHPLSQNGPNGHPNCRCARAPIAKSWRDLGVDLDEPDDAFPDARSRFDALADADQIAILGVARLALLRSGLIDWDDIPVERDNPGWRSSFVPRSVRDLRRLADRRSQAA